MGYGLPSKRHLIDDSIVVSPGKINSIETLTEREKKIRSLVIT